MLKFPTLFVVVLLAIPALVWSKDAVQSDQEKLQGTWTPTQLLLNGLDVSEENRAKLSMEFKGKQIWLNNKTKFTFTLNAAPTPRLIDITTDQGVTLEGIYRFREKGDVVEICLHEPSGVKQRPLEFTGNEGSGQILLVLERQK